MHCQQYAVHNVACAGGQGSASRGSRPAAAAEKDKAGAEAAGEADGAQPLDTEGPCCGRPLAGGYSTYCTAHQAA